MEHKPLFLLAILYSIAPLQLQLALNAEAQSVELQPESGYGSGSGWPEEGAAAATYDEIMVMLMTKMENARPEPEVMAGGSGTSPGGITPVGDSACSPHPLDVRLTYRGCVTTYPTFSCTGRCRTHQRPSVFYSRQDARSDPFITTCKCCSVVDAGFLALILSLDCPDNSTLLVYHLTAYAADCSCSSCF